ncbi:transmembrane protein (plasmid) [Legionella adelaidensis]|uniref:Transmembrane protein n=1 Tax=Legionella adelaidensis TaxID=45056 RepID=A0A0W0R105_9GAMM|nr:NfeD family protein [Legionella adelaidensis]KTC64754.1 transmembrane protein [Legionella adelaidensis]VEH81309.1 transmembrane protein [Legionella adelaidensis]
MDKVRPQDADLLGKHGQAVGPIAETGQVLLLGKLWQAYSLKKIAANSPVKITGVGEKGLEVEEIRDEEEE